MIAISSIGSLREELAPGRFVVVDQFIDRTVPRPASFFGTGMVAHVSMAEPVCARLSALCGASIAAAGGDVAQGGIYLAKEGPQFSTRAECLMYRQWGADVIGMTAMPEAKLAREAELPYALVGMITDYDCWREESTFVEVAQVIEQMTANGALDPERRRAGRRGAWAAHRRNLASIPAHALGTRPKTVGCQAAKAAALAISERVG